MIKVFAQNHFEVNCSLIYDQTGECVLVDVCSQKDYERQEIIDFINKNELRVKHILLTHPHIDHVCGALWASETFNLPLEMHQDGEEILSMAEVQAQMMGFNVEGIDHLKKLYISKLEKIHFGDSELRVIETPGHCAGSLSFYNEKEGFVITGDALFQGSIGRTDLPTGDFDLLSKSIKENLFTLPENTECICGHGPNTTIGFEKENNPFLN